MSTPRLPRATPESPRAWHRQVARVRERRLGHVHSLMVVRRGSVIAEGGGRPTARTGHALFSLSKSVTSTAIGLLVEDGRLSLDDRVVRHAPRCRAGAIDERLAGMAPSPAVDEHGPGAGRPGGGGRDDRLGATHPGRARDPCAGRGSCQTGATYLLAAIATR
ncbi:MAG: serine hydrolase domain-containing protein [Chloroflexota bacterium]